jgi:putative phosphonate catabolism associated alcohol dehydrogenase
MRQAPSSLQTPNESASNGKPELFHRMIFDGPTKKHRLTTSIDQPQLAAGEILVRIAMATICGSDLHTYEGRRSAPTPCVLGHEAVGHIVSVGSDVNANRIGQRITWTLTDTCGCCLACNDWNLPQKCDSLFKYGHSPISDDEGYNGCFSSHLILKPGTDTVTLPENLPDSFVAPANCALATMVAVIEKIPLHAKKILIQGAGLLGIYGSALLRDRGVELIFVSDPVKSRLEQIEKFGGWRLTESDNSPGSFDAVIEVAGVPDVIEEGLRLLRPGGTYVLAGMVHEDTKIEIRGVDLVRGCISIVGVHNYATPHLIEGVEFLTRSVNKYPWSELVSPPLPLSCLDEAFSLSQTRRWARVSVVPDTFL